MDSSWLSRAVHSGPSEAYLARKIRNLAIPASERRSKNVLDATAANLQQARELFVEHCSLCHGLDGGARTQLGETLYPRVPDLRTAQTQSLSDGELHYIIENGVQLTGMPAFTDPHEDSRRGAWLLVSYVRSLASSYRAQEEQRAANSSARFIGSQACAKCQGPPNTFVRSHTFKFIAPASTVKYKIPNPCNSCHQEKSPEWAAETVRHWSERSPWRVS